MDNLTRAALQSISDICRGTLGALAGAPAEEVRTLHADGYSDQAMPAGAPIKAEPSLADVEEWLQRCSEGGGTWETRLLAAAALGAVRYPRFNVEDFPGLPNLLGECDIQRTHDTIANGHALPIIFRNAGSARRLLRLARIGEAAMAIAGDNDTVDRLIADLMADQKLGRV